MSSKFHINPETGSIGECKAKIKCAFADSDGSEPEHYATYEEAYVESEKLLKEEYGDFSTYKPYDNQEEILEEKLDKIWKSPHSHTKDAEDIRKTPFYLIDVDTATSIEITRISSAKGTITFWDAKSNEVQQVNQSDTVAYSDIPVSEILDN